jgi:AcrB/AcrD/AcrF family
MAPLNPSWCNRRDLVVFLAGLIVGCATWWITVKVTTLPATAPTSAKILPGVERNGAVKLASVIQVFTDCPGMSAESVEKTITNRIKVWVNQAPGAVRIESKSEKGASLVTVYFRADADSATALTTTNELVLGVLPELPNGILPPIVLPCPESGPREVGDILKLLSKPARFPDRPGE